MAATHSSILAWRIPGMGSHRVGHDRSDLAAAANRYTPCHVRLWELDHNEGRALKNWCLWTVVLEKTPESPLDYKEIKPLNLKCKSTLSTHWKDWCWSQYFGLQIQRADSLEKTLMLRKIDGRRKRGHQRMRWLVGINDTVDMNLGKLQEMVRNRETWHAAVHWGCKESDMTGQLNNNRYILWYTLC